MSNRNPILLTSFERLQQRLYRLKSSKINTYEEIANPYAFSHSITDIENNIFSVDLEDAEDNLDHYKAECEVLLKGLNTILKKYTFTGKFNGWPNGQFIPPTKASELKKKFKLAILQELNFYIKELTKLRVTVLEKFEKLGDERFSNAGYKIVLDLTVPEIGSLFNLFFETQIIKQNKIAGKKLTKKKLAEFITKNFSSTTEENISAKHINNKLSHNDQAAEASIVQKLDLMINLADQEHPIKRRNSK